MAKPFFSPDWSFPTKSQFQVDFQLSLSSKSVRLTGMPESFKHFVINFTDHHWLPDETLLELKDMQQREKIMAYVTTVVRDLPLGKIGK